MADSDDLIGRRGALVGGLWNAAQMVLPLVATLILSVVMGRVLGPDDLGIQSLIAYVESMLAGLLAMSLTTATIQTIAAAKGGQDRRAVQALAYWSMRLQLFNGLVSGIVLIIVGLLSDQSLPWILAGATSILNTAGWAYSSRVIGWTGSWRDVASRRVFFQVLSQVLGVAGVLAGFGLVSVFAANLLSAGVLLPVLRQQAKNSGIPRAIHIGFPPTRLMTLWGMYIVRSGLIQVVGQRIEFLFLAGFSSADQIAFYSIAFMLVSAGVMVPQSIVNSALASMAAHVARNEESEVRKHVGHAMRVTMAGSWILAAGIAGLGPSLVTNLYGPDFAAVTPLILWMAPLALLLPMAEILETYWGSVARLGITLSTAAVGAVLDLVLCLLLIPRFDATGAAVANLVGQGSAAVLLVALSWQRIGRPQLALARNLVNFSVMCGTAIAVILVTAKVQGVGGLLLGTLLFSAVVLVLGSVRGFILPSDREWLEEALPAPLVRFLPLFAGRPVGVTR